METLETVKVVRADLPEGYMIINKADLTDEYQIYGADASAAKKKKADPAPADQPAAE